MIGCWELENQEAPAAQVALALAMSVSPVGQKAATIEQQSLASVLHILCSANSIMPLYKCMVRSHSETV